MATALSGSAVRVLPRSLRSRRAARSIRRPSRSRSAGVIRPAARWAARSRSCQASIFVSVEGTRDRTADDAPRARARRRRTGWRLQRERRRRHRPVHRPNRFPATGFPRRASTRPARRSPPCTRCRTAPDDGATSSRRPSGRTTSGRSPARPISTCATAIGRFSCATASRATTATRPFPGPGKNLPGFGTRDAGRHAEPRGRAHAVASRRACSTTCASAGIGCTATCFPTTAASTASRALGMTGPSLPRRRRRALPRSTWPASTRSATTCRCRSCGGTHTLHVSDTVSVERGRHFIKAGGEFRHYRSDGYNHLFPRGQLNFQGAYTGSGIARPAARAADRDAAGDQRQPAGAADDGGQPVRAGRLAGDHAGSPSTPACATS